MSAVVIDVVRSPMGRGKQTGALAGVHPVDLLAQVLAALVERSDLDPGTVDDVLVGCVGQNLEQSATPGRQAVLAAGFPEHVPSVTIERKCGSGQQAVDFAVQGVTSGAYDIAIAAGLESMSRVPMGSARGEADAFGPAVRRRYPQLVPQGISAELVARKWGLTRHQLDAYAARSHELAARARDHGGFENEIVAITTPDGVVVRSDETIRDTTTIESLAALPPAFARAPWNDDFPELDFRITAGNASQLSDGAAAALIMSEEKATELGLRPRARIVASAVIGDDPLLMLTGPIPATRKVLHRAGMTIADIDAFEVNEAFASVPLAWMSELGVPQDLLNPRGGAIALGHPLGASGVRIFATLINHLEQTGGRFGLQTMCEAGGMANALVVEALATT